MLLRGESFATKDQKEMPVSPGLRRFAIDRMYQLAWMIIDDSIIWKQMAQFYATEHVVLPIDGSL